MKKDDARMPMRTVAAIGGRIERMEVPKPELHPHALLVQTCYSAVSPGTETTLAKNMERQTPMRLGYSAMGIVREIGSEVSDFVPGQYVACYGAPYVHHAEYLAVPKQLAAPLSPQTDGIAASFAGLGAIAIHALRQAQIQFGETVVVAGLGILGQLIAQIARASACEVIAYDLTSDRCNKLREVGISAVVSSQEDVEVLLPTNPKGADAVILCVGGEPEGLLDQALSWIRDRGKIVIVGEVKTDFNRGKLFQKEAQILTSRAGGPGRYDYSYEYLSIDYPAGYVRWTEGRNLREYVRLLENGLLQVKPLVSGIYPFSEALSAYDELLSTKRSGTLGMVFDYGR